MTTKSSRRLVIDASVARSSGGEDAVFPTSKNCRDFLKAVLEICHHVVLTPEIREEWHKHKSKFTKRWLRSMFAQKKAELIDSAEDRVLRGKIDQASQNEKASRIGLMRSLCLGWRAAQKRIRRDAWGQGGYSRTERSTMKFDELDEKMRIYETAPDHGLDCWRL